MKAILNNPTVLKWGIIVLLVANLSAMITIFYSIKRKNIPALYNNSRMKAPGRDNISVRPFAERLNFTPAQFTDFQNLRKDHLTEMADLHQELTDLRIEIANELSRDEPDTENLKKLANDFGSIQSNIKFKSFDHFSRIKKICNNKQKEIFNSNINSFIEDQRPRPGLHHRKQNRRNQNFNN